jgi:hypothetical protein
MVFNTTQHLIAKQFYLYACSLQPEQVEVMSNTLVLLQTLIEESYQTLRSQNISLDFYVHCFDNLLGSMLALKMLKDDGILKDKNEFNFKKRDVNQNLKEAILALERIEKLFESYTHNTQQN